LLVERTAQHDRALVGAEQGARGRVEPDDRTVGVEDHQRVGHAGQDRLELGDAALDLCVEPLGAAQVLDRDRGDAGDALEQGEVLFVVGVGLVALDEQDADGAVAPE
jgi:hypothetical protein